MSYQEWTPQQHIDEACRLAWKYAAFKGGNPPTGMVLAGVHANIAQAKLTLSVIEVRPTTEAERWPT